MKKLILPCLIFLLFFSLCSNAQTVSHEEELKKIEEEEKKFKKEFNYSKTQNAIGDIKLAQEYIGKGRYQMAKAELNAALRKQKKKSVAYRLLGMVETELQNWAAAINYYEKSFKLNPKLSRAAYFECAEIYFKLGQFDQAYDLFNLYDGMFGTSYVNSGNEDGIETHYNDLLYRRLKSCTKAQDAIKSPIGKDPILLNKYINTKADEYMPSLHSYGDVMIFTRENNIDGKEADENIFITQKENEQWEEPKKIKGDLNTTLNEGMAKFTFDGQQIYYAGCGRGYNGGCDLFTASIQEFKALDSIRVRGYVNLPQSWDSQPSITCDQQSIFFSSTREESIGGSDIYVSYRKNDAWTPPENLGPSINTKYDEEAPFISADGKTLYFSSNGQDGLGEGDIYMSTIGPNGWSEPVNLGYPINTQFKEIGFSITPDGKTAYVSSNRFGGNGGLDIYQIEMPESLRPESTALIYGKITDYNTSKAVPAQVLAVHDELRYKMFTRPDGTFFMCLPKAPTYAFIVDEPGYEQYVEAVFVGDNPEKPIVEVDIKLQADGYALDMPETPSLEIEKIDKGKVSHQRKIYGQSQIFFKSGESEITTRGKIALNDLIEGYTRNNGFTLTIVGYADDIGSASSNKQLSQKRANNVADYLAFIGVKTSEVRIEAIGEVNTNGQQLTEEMRRLSRRVEVTLEKIN